ncbi:MAG TPA: hypothetical protein VF120_11625 [Ktedonobacterales bacterium]
MCRDYLRLIDTHTSGPRYDVTPLFADHSAFAALVDDLAREVEGVQFDLIAGIDALGFILGAALALRLRKGFVPIRKGGKLPVPTDAIEFTDYSGSRKSLELRQSGTGALRLGVPVLVMDEWIETGAQVRASVTLIESQGGIVAGIATIHMDENEQTKRLAQTYPCFQVWPGDV